MIPFLFMASHIGENYHVINNRVLELNPKAQLICVSKTKPIEDLKEAFEAGARVFGENFVDEIVEKAPQLPDAKFHMIGHLQSNKVPKLCRIPNLAMIQTIDTESLADKINARWPEEFKPLEVLIQVNTSDEPQKHGVSHGEAAIALAKHIVSSCPRLVFRGLMTIGETGEAERDFKTLTDERAAIAEALGVLPESLELSMGMSADYELALKMGATYVRVGSSIFGPRIYKNKH